jgi:hypothetical protein
MVRKVRPPGRLRRLPPTLECADPVVEAARPRPLSSNQVLAEMLDAGAQPKLVVGPSGDAFEQEADRTASEVVAALRRATATTSVGVSAGAAGGGTAGGGMAAASVQASGDTVGAAGGPVGTEIERAIAGARGAGRPLDEAVRSRMEPAFGADFGGVRLHDGAEAAALNDRLQAKAFTVGQDIFLRDGIPDGRSGAGQELLAHELTHTIQQGGPSVRRLMSFDGKSLKGLTSTKGKILNSSLHQLVGTYRKYVDAAVGKAGATAEYGLLVQMKKLVDQWMAHRDEEGDAGDLSSSQKKKATILTSMAAAIDAEIPIVKERARRHNLVANLGLPPEYVEELTLPDVTLLTRADWALGQGDLGTADKALSALRKSMGDGPVNLIKSSLMRRHIGKVNPQMAKVFDDPKYKLVDKGEIAAGSAKVQSLANDRIGEIDDLSKQYPRGKPADMDDADFTKIDVKLMEGRMQKPVLSNLKASAKTMKDAPAGKKPLGGLSEEEISAILGYSTNLYGKFNAPLRSGVDKLPADQASLTKLAVSGLNKLPAHQGQVFRHGGLFPGYKALNKVGGVMVDMAFLSTAREQSGCVSAAEQHEVLEVLTCKSGRDISKVSAFGAGEAEVLFRPGTRFKVLRVVERAADGSWPDPETKAFAEQTSKKAQIQMVIYKAEV